MSVENWTPRRPDRTLPLREAASACVSKPARQLVEVYEGWMSGADGRIPTKSTIDLVSLAPVMSDLLLYALSGDEKCICRLAGEAVKQAVATEIVGRNYFELVPDERRDHARHAMRMVIDQPSGFRCEIAQRLTNDLDRTLESLALPLASTEEGVDGFVLVTVTSISKDDDLLNGATQHGGINVTRRDLIDLGFGVDETFVDFLPT